MNNIATMTDWDGDEPPVWDQLFHQCALTAYVEVMRESKAFPPDTELVKRRAYAHYESELSRGRSTIPVA